MEGILFLSCFQMNHLAVEDGGEKCLDCLDCLDCLLSVWVSECLSVGAPECSEPLLLRRNSTRMSLKSFWVCWAESLWQVYVGLWQGGAETPRFPAGTAAHRQSGILPQAHTLHTLTVYRVQPRKKLSGVNENEVLTLLWWDQCDAECVGLFSRTSCLESNSSLLSSSWLQTLQRHLEFNILGVSKALRIFSTVWVFVWRSVSGTSAWPLHCSHSS